MFLPPLPILLAFPIWLFHSKERQRELVLVSELLRGRERERERERLSLFLFSIYFIIIFFLCRLPFLLILWLGDQRISGGQSRELQAMDACGKSMNVIYLSTILGRDSGLVSVHKCDWKCENENVCGNMYRCKLTGLTHICDKNCNQRILYDNHNSLCLVSCQIFPLSPVEEQVVRGVCRKLDADHCTADSCASKRRRDAQFHPSPFERSFSAASPICSQVGDGMDTN